MELFYKHINCIENIQHRYFRNNTDMVRENSTYAETLIFLDVILQWHYKIR